MDESASTSGGRSVEAAGTSRRRPTLSPKTSGGRRAKVPKTSGARATEISANSAARTRRGRAAAGSGRPAPRAEAGVTPDLRRERQWWRRGHHLVAGVDEVGRGAWAGPVTVGAVVVACDIGRMPRRLRDSKQLPAEVREGIYDELVAWSTAWAVGHAGPDECDRLGMTAALRLAARRAFRELGRELLPDVVVLDGSFDYLSEPHDRPLFDVNSEPSVLDVNDVVGAVSGWVPTVQTVIGGDASCASVAAASVLAKVTRDRLMRDDAECYPAFEFDRNKGYPTRVHRRALNGYGMTAIHRRSWVFADDLPWLGRRVQRIAPGVPWAGCPPDTAEVRAFDMTEALTP